MRCRKAESLLSRLLDERLEADEQLQLESHLAGCASCRAELDAWRSISERLRAEPAAAVPPFLAEKAWRAALAPRPAPSFAERFIAVCRPAALAGALAAAVLWLGPMLQSRSGSASAEEIVPRDAIELAQSVWIEEALYVE
jgi:anti-sigma factor RsiW